MEAEFDTIDENEGGMILFKVCYILSALIIEYFQEFCVWAFSKNFDIEDDIDSQDEDQDE